VGAVRVSGTPAGPAAPVRAAGLASPAPAGGGRPRPRVVYLGGLGRSGTTLLERLLGEMPGVCSAGEVVHLWQRGIVENERCGCGEQFRDCPFWSRVGQEAFGGWDSIDVSRVARLNAAVDRTRHIPWLAAPAPGLARRGDLQEYTSYYQRVYTGIMAASGCRALVDSSKHASLAFCLRWRDDLDLRVVHVVRDSRAVAHSWTREVSRPEAATESFMTRYSPAVAAAQWNAQNGAVALLARCGTPTLRVRYEDLTRAPAATLARIAEFAGLVASPGGPPIIGGGASGRWAELGAAHTVSGNPMRFTTGRVPIRQDERWRTAMPARQRRTVTALTLPLLARYGYCGRAA
jgi:Sulfotransferase family